MIKRYHENIKGFTLIELMVVIAIIGILSAVAIPQFAAYRTRSYAAALKSDAHSLSNAQEAYFTDNGTYASMTTSILTTTYGVDDLSDFTTIIGFGGTATDFSFSLDDTVHSGVVTIVYNNSAGGLQ